MLLGKTDGIPGTETPLPGSHAGKLSLRVALVCDSNIHKRSEERIRKCQIAELLALTHHRGEVKESTGKHRTARPAAGLLGFRPSVHFLYGVVCYLSSGMHCLQTKTVEETLRKDINLLKQTRKNILLPLILLLKKKHLLVMFSLGPSHCYHHTQTLHFLPQMFPLEHLPLPGAKGELETSQNRCLGNFVGSAPDFWLRSVSQSQGRNRKAGWKLDATRIRSSGSCVSCNTQ